MRASQVLVLPSLLCCSLACQTTGGVDPPTPDASVPDAGTQEDAGHGMDASMTDAATADAAVPDASTPDAHVDVDAGPVDPLGDGGVPTVQLNDVSILFPLSSNGADLATGYLRANASGARGELLPQAVYDAIGHISGSTGDPPPGGIGETVYGELYVVGLRVDPCFAALQPDPHGAGCNNQLRLVMQELRARTNGVDAFDSALHLFYTLTREELLNVVRALTQLRLQNTQAARLGALAPHPIMVQQGLDGAYARGVRATILAYAGAQNLTRITRMSATTVGFAWDFDGFDISQVAPPMRQSMIIPTLANQATQQSFFRGFGADVEGFVSPSTTHADDLTPLTSLNVTQGLTEMERNAAFTALVRVNHPARHSPDTMDCVSCHLATPMAELVGVRHYNFVEATHPEAFQPDGTFVLSSEMGHRFDPAATFNLHAFSYLGRDAAINQRTVNETAAIVAYLNTLP